MTRPINLKPGHFVAVIKIKEDEPDDDMPAFPFGPYMSQRHQGTVYNGKPFKVLAVSLPFVCCTDGIHKIGFDTRHFTLQRISKEYAMAMDTPAERGQRQQGHTSIFNARQPKPEKPDERDCPRCGNRMTERLRNPGSGEWPLVCKNCEQGQRVTKVVV